MIHYKTPDEIKTMQQGGAILKEVMREVVLQVKPGITTMEIDQLVQKGLKKEERIYPLTKSTTIVGQPVPR